VSIYQRFNIVPILLVVSRSPSSIQIMTGSTYSIFFMGNPLLDMQVMNGEKLLKKYGLKADDAILAEEKHLGMYDLFFCVALTVKLIPCFHRSYDELVNEHQVTYLAGGAAQNAARGAAVSLDRTF